MKSAQIENGKVVNVILGSMEGYISCPDDVGIGWLYAEGVFTAPPPPVPVVPVPAVYEWYIDIGPFFDRFGAAKLAVLMSPDAAVQAILRDTQIRKWIDLKKPEVAQSVAYIGTKVSGITAEVQTAVLNNPVSLEENMALRKLYFS
jgi:hypothetical protein